MSKFHKDLTSGNVVKQLLMFSLPFLISNLVQSFYNVADMLIVGQYCGSYSISGVNIGGQVTFVVTNLVIGLCLGGTVLIGQYLGSKQQEAVRETIGTMLTALLFLAIIITGIMLLLGEPVLRLMRTPVEAFEESRDYLNITMLGTIFIFGYNALSAIMRGMGDSKRPLIFVTIACCVNVALDFLFVGHFGMAARGAALATVISQAISMILCIVYLKKNNFIFDFRISSFKFYGKRLNLLFKIGFPASVQNTIVGLSFMFLTSLVNGYGVMASAALGVVSKFNGFAIMPSIAMGMSISAMAAQNIGAGHYDRVRIILKTGIKISAIISLFIFIIAQAFPSQILALFDNEPEMISAGILYMRSFSFDYLLVPFVFGFNGVITGAGHTTFTLINSILSSLVIRIPIAYLIGIVMNVGLAGIGMGAPVATLVSMILAAWYYMSNKWMKATVVDNQKVCDVG